MKNLKKTPDELKTLCLSAKEKGYSSVDLYCQDESRYGLMTVVGRCITSCGVKPIVKCKQAFKNTYLYGAFSPITGDSFLIEINRVDNKIFERFITDFAKEREKQLNIMVIDNAGFHATKNITIPDNVVFIRIPPYSPELNPAEKVWQYIKQDLRNRLFDTLEDLKKWLYERVEHFLGKERVKSLTHHSLYVDNFIGMTQ